MKIEISESLATIVSDVAKAKELGVNVPSEVTTLVEKAQRVTGLNPEAELKISISIG